MDLSQGLESSTDPGMVTTARAARAVGLSRLADLAQARGDSPAALELFTRAQTLLKDLATTHPHNIT